jgi:hypothetical protein
VPDLGSLTFREISYLYLEEAMKERERKEREKECSEEK